MTEPFSSRVNAVIENQQAIWSMLTKAKALSASELEEDFGISRDQKKALIEYLERAHASMAKILAAQIPAPEDRTSE